MKTYPAPSLADWLAERPFTLAMSSGFFGFFAHFGVVKALKEHELQPTRYCGSSAGALVAACMASQACPESMEHTLLGLSREHFWDPAPGLGLLAGNRFRALLQELLPITDLAHSPTPVALSVWHAASRRTRVLNAGDPVEAVYASCAVPFLFQPACIDGGYYWDGGIADRHGLAGTWPGERVLYHHLQSRSPWRRANSPALQAPLRANLTTLAIDGLTRSGPGKLEQGRVALQQAYDATRQALAKPVRHGMVKVASV
ncbi:MAG: NTE family protein [Alcanivorax sp.]|jgi:NTE family protein|uniref:patatin-like phospholipase family protein n=1 Tax=unclassified Alcanivorax TaxID=2638842 RepID=UPI000C90530A|nr:MULTISPECIES: patatin-like phospholipase family protein [unclassified Alcanivorax]MAC14396.1 patatin [Alcanivorax sp.]|tara:strand:+ start:306 stop:1079 length:774 start_codon:yes stop_codon:yes gene_type:complete